MAPINRQPGGIPDPGGMLKGKPPDCIDKYKTEGFSVK